MKTNNTFKSLSKIVGRFKLWPVILVTSALMVFVAVVPGVWADEDDDMEIPFDEAMIYFELNNTDGDLGIHALIDGEPWKRLEIEDPNERRMLGVNVRGRLRRQGLTEIFFESAEPTFDELSPEKFFKRFPEGTYEIEGITLEGDELESEVEVSHVMPAPAAIYVNGNPAAPDCEDEDSFPVVSPGVPVIISWDPVKWSHPDPDGGGAGVQPPVGIDVHNYEVVVEIDDTPWKTSVILAPDADSFQVPPEILDMAFDDESEGEVKFEVLVRAENNNQTAVESCFAIVE